VLALAQISVLTQHYDNARSGQNTNESVLTHANVNPVQFGKLFAQPLDGKEAGQPLYVPGVYIPANATTHNVIYVATQHDSVYAFDADNNLGSNSVPLWQVNFLNPAAGVTTVPVADIVCRVTGFTEFGIVSTPVIDSTRHAIYVLAMTKENGAYVHKLQALDLGTGAELFGGPVQISASVSIAGKTYNFIDKYQMQRPALLLQNGVIFIAFGSPGCNNGTEMGWVMAYDAATLNQVGVFDDSPGSMPIWGELISATASSSSQKMRSDSVLQTTLLLLTSYTFGLRTTIWAPVRSCFCPTRAQATSRWRWAKMG
jgi:hypothetical protein